MPQIIPSNPSTTSFVRIQSSGSGCLPALEFERDGFAIELRETKDCGCVVTAPPYLLEVQLGQLPVGEYQIHHTIYAVPIEETCEVELLGEGNYTFSVMQAIVPPPVFVPIPGTAALVLALALAVCAAVVLRHRSGAQA